MTLQKTNCVVSQYLGLRPAHPPTSAPTMPLNRGVSLNYGRRGPTADAAADRSVSNQQQQQQPPETLKQWLQTCTPGYSTTTCNLRHSGILKPMLYAQ